MIDACVFIHEPIHYKNFKIYPPTVREVIRNPKFSQYMRLLTFSQEEIEDEFIEKDKMDLNLPTPFDFLLANCYNNGIVENLAKEAFYFFFREEANFLYEEKMILFGDVKEILVKAEKITDFCIIDKNNFFEIQNLIRESVGRDKVEKPNPDEDPRVKRIKAKARYRDKIKAKKGGGISLSASLTAICCMGLGITPLNIGEMSFAAINPIIQMYQEKEKYEIDIQSLLAGADSKKIKPKYWIRNLE